jgi:hypothetical protein
MVIEFLCNCEVYANQGFLQQRTVNSDLHDPIFAPQPSSAMPLD